MGYPGARLFTLGKYWLTTTLSTHEKKRKKNLRLRCEDTPCSHERWQFIPTAKVTVVHWKPETAEKAQPY